MQAQANVRERLDSTPGLVIGEGSHAMIFRIKDKPNICGKFHKSGYNPKEYEILDLAHAAGLSVPAPFGEAREQNVFMMQLLQGKSLLLLMQQGKRFADPVYDECAAIVARFNSQSLVHGNLSRESIFLTELEMKGDLVVRAKPFLIGLYAAHRGAKREWTDVHQWFKNHRIA